MTATYQGVAGHDAEWDDLSPEGAPRVIDALTSFRARLAALPPSTERWELLARSIARDYLDLELERYEHGDHLVDLNNIASSFQAIRMVFDVMNTSSVEGWNDIVTRLATIDRVCDGYRRALAAGLALGRTVARRQVLACIEQGRVHGGERSYFRTMPGALERSGVSTPELASRLSEAVEHACKSYGALTDWLESDYLPSAREKDAVGHERYLRMARRFLGMQIDAADTYAWGWEQVREIGESMRKVAAEIRPGASVAEVIELLRTDPERCAPSADAFLSLMRERQEKAVAALSGTHFDIPDPVRRVDVKLAPPGSTLGAYYIPPSDGFGRNGTVWYALGDKQRVPLFDEISVAYHEGFPGHHLQCGIQVWLTDRLSRLHRVGEGYSGYAEGWALYTERLMHELGFYEKPDYVLGMLACQMMRACRVVIDIGCHLELPIPEGQSFHPGERWSFDLGVEMMTNLAGLDLDNARSEMTRYLGWPGQAISYKVGERVIFELRDEAKRREGAAFDLKRFHARVLGSGPVGLASLRDIVVAS
ncbi:MAG: DUF885 domain-containing protein [Deltaproteobacteria bacterium]|nr:DUF885 domain-containing protein [Deltaproteobacteria bacterium]